MIKHEIVKIIKNNLFYIIGLLFFIPLAALMNTRVSILTGDIIDQISDSNKVVRLVILLAGILIVKFIFEQINMILKKYISATNEIYFRRRMHSVTLEAQFSQLQQWKRDEIFQMWDKDMKELDRISVGTLLEFFSLAVNAAIAAIAIAAIEPIFLLICALVYFFAAVPIQIIGKQNEKVTKELRPAEMKMNNIFFDIFKNINLVKSYGKEGEEVKQFSKANKQYNKFKIRSLIYSKFYSTFIRVNNATIPLLVLLIGYFKFNAGGITVGNIITALSLMNIVCLPMKSIGSTMIEIKGIKVRLHNLFQYINLKEEENSCSSESVSSGDLVLENVSVLLNNKKILKNISLTIEAGTSIAIIGESGSGKTTLGNVLVGLMKPDSGAYLINGTNICELDHRSFWNKISFMQSKPYIIDDTLENNLLVNGADKSIVNSTIYSIDFEGHIEGFSYNMHQRILQNGLNLSGGQKKKIGIIRGLSIDKEYYIFDEITTGIDEAHAEMIMRHILQHYKTKTLIFITHRLNELEQMDKIIVMKNGEIYGIGNHEDLLKNCPYYREMYNEE